VTERLVLPREAAAWLARRLRDEWARGVCGEVDGADPVRLTIGLRPNVSSGSAAVRLGIGVWRDWAESWREVAAVGLPGVEVESKEMKVVHVPEDVPTRLTVTGLDAVVSLVEHLAVDLPPIDLTRARVVARTLREAGAMLNPPTLRKACKLSDADVGVLAGAVKWLADHPDVGDWTARQLPMPGMHSKWLETNGPLLRDVSGRDVRDEVRPRLAVVHLTYVDPGYRATGGRRHDAWTTGDVHDLAYRPSTVLVVENRDSRLWFPPVAGVIVVEGGGKAAAALLADILWVRRADRVVYWGDIDADGFAILDHFRRALAAPGRDGTPGRVVSSILMDAMAAHRYASLGVSTDKEGEPIPPSPAHLTNLTGDENAAYHAVATAGPAEFRRIEQERIPGEHAKAALEALLRG
jgi:hypothetical protein